MSDRPDAPRTTVLTLQQKKDRGEPITMLTAYDFPTASLVDAAGVDAILVGDSLAMVVLGHETTLAVTMDEMLHHARAVSRGARRALRVGDMPFLSYQADAAEAVRNAGRFLKEAGMDAVKLEGGREAEAAVRAIVRAGIPVVGHIGLQPQSVHRLGGFRVQGRTAEAALALVDDARRSRRPAASRWCSRACRPAWPRRSPTRVRIPTIGIGAGAGTRRAGAGAPRPRRASRRHRRGSPRVAPRSAPRSSARRRRSGARSSRAPFPAPSTPSRCPRRSGRPSVRHSPRSPARRSAGERALAGPRARHGSDGHRVRRGARAARRGPRHARGARGATPSLPSRRGARSSTKRRASGACRRPRCRSRTPGRRDVVLVLAKSHQTSALAPSPRAPRARAASS